MIDAAKLQALQDEAARVKFRIGEIDALHDERVELVARLAAIAEEERDEVQGENFPVAPDEPE